MFDRYYPQSSTSRHASSRNVAEIAESMRVNGWQGGPIRAVEHNGIDLQLREPIRIFDEPTLASNYWSDDMPQRVIVDENAGPGAPVWEQFQRTRSGELAEFLFLKESHPGIPDVEILDKLLPPGAVLLTGDRVLHMQALHRGCRSHTQDEHGNLTQGPLPGIRASEPVESVHRELQDDYYAALLNTLPLTPFRFTSDVPR